MANRSKDKGTKFETATARYMSAHGIPAERVALHGTGDEGDLKATVRGMALAIECKDRKRIEAVRWMDEAEREALNAGADVPVLVVHRPGCGAAKAGGNLVVMRLDDFCAICAGGKR